MFGPTDNDGYSSSKKDASWKAKKCVANSWTCRNCYCTPRNEFHKWKIKSGALMMRRKTIKCSTASSCIYMANDGKMYPGFEEKPLAFKLVTIARTTSRNACQLMEQQISYYYCHGSPYQPPTPEILLLKAIPKFWILPAPFPLCRHFSLLVELETRQLHPRASTIIATWIQPLCSSGMIFKCNGTHLTLRKFQILSSFVY